MEEETWSDDRSSPRDAADLDEDDSAEGWAPAEKSTSMTAHFVIAGAVCGISLRKNRFLPCTLSMHPLPLIIQLPIHLSIASFCPSTMHYTGSLLILNAEVSDVTSPQTPPFS